HRPGSARSRRSPDDAPARHRDQRGLRGLGPRSTCVRDSDVSLARQRGIALLVAIVMFAIATTVAAAITYNKAMAARRAAATFALEQALQAGMAAEGLAAIALENNATSRRTRFHDTWDEPLGPVEIEGTGVWIQAQLEDLSARFNLNSLVEWNGATNQFEIDNHQVDVF